MNFHMKKQHFPYCSCCKILRSLLRTIQQHDQNNFMSLSVKGEYGTAFLNRRSQRGSGSFQSRASTIICHRDLTSEVSMGSPPECSILNISERTWTCRNEYKTFSALRTQIPDSITMEISLWITLEHYIPHTLAFTFPWQR